MSQDSETISLDLANDLSQEEENETQHKEPTTKSIGRWETVQKWKDENTEVRKIIISTFEKKTRDTRV